MMNNFIKPFASTSELNEGTYPEYLNALGWNTLRILVVLQILLVPSHIFTTDYLDPSSRSSMFGVRTKNLGRLSV